jgi:hypothetical protein
VDALCEYTGSAITGRILVPASVSEFHGACAHVWLEDVSYADRKAVVVGEVALANVDHVPQPDRAATELAFSIEAHMPIDPAHDYAVRVWIDRDSDGRAASGDLWSDQSHRVLTRSFGSEVTITLTQR